MNRWVLASGNAGKLAELRTLLAAAGLELESQRELGVAEAEETGLTFVENALIKARNAAAATGLPAIADDSGLEVGALGGAPGVRSARYAGGAASDAENVALLLERMADVPSGRRSARFYCVVVALRHPADPTPLMAEGAWHGRIAAAPRGSGGFGYDPVFEVPELGRTAAELDRASKNRLSHRARALAALAERLPQWLGP
jgi:XTP/dITP diphosphohydrolase